MKLSITLSPHYQPTAIRDLLENEWLIPRKTRHFLRIRKNVTRNGKTAMFHDMAYPGDIITLTFEAADYTQPLIHPGKAKIINILWEDEHIIIVDKPAGVKTHPNQPDEKNTLLNDLAAYLSPQNQLPYVVHRLDKETSGAILFAKNPIILPVLGRMLEQKKIQRTYEAEIVGHLPQKTIIIDKPIGRHRHDRRKRVIDQKGGQRAITHVTEEAINSETSWVTCQLDTGRTHQIRVHLSSIGHPIVGDPLYQQQGKTAPRLQLHAKELSLIHPFTKVPVNIKTAHQLSEL
ncbi:RluA family pseudouridine synthase [Vagococcus vulneris]|uniref:Pseudouridine synthase n=1 Tax=Vagococcus vulneris TaxID=1977869 RepID=A0A429ZXJ1_9ENTE|nr:RluA family pseudouridine synthase [Vagococcus vulneris]RST98588.1 RNA pseudouridine synthase [Vagococcus vulneris]